MTDMSLTAFGPQTPYMPRDRGADTTAAGKENGEIASFEQMAERPESAKPSKQNQKGGSSTPSSGERAISGSSRAWKLRESSEVEPSPPATEEGAADTAPKNDPLAVLLGLGATSLPTLAPLPGAIGNQSQGSALEQNGVNAAGQTSASPVLQMPGGSADQPALIPVTGKPGEALIHSNAGQQGEASAPAVVAMAMAGSGGQLDVREAASKPVERAPLRDGAVAASSKSESVALLTTSAEDALGQDAQVTTEPSKSSDRSLRDHRQGPDASIGGLELGLKTSEIIELSSTSHLAPAGSALQQVATAVRDVLGPAPGAPVPAGPDFSAPREVTPTLHVLNLKLQPESLGQVAVHMRLSGEALSVHIKVADAATLASFQSGSNKLEDLLKASGYQVDKLTIVATATVATEHASASDLGARRDGSPSTMTPGGQSQERNGSGGQGSRGQQDGFQGHDGQSHEASVPRSARSGVYL